MTVDMLRAEKLKSPNRKTKTPSPLLNPYVRLSYEDTTRRSRVVMQTNEPDFACSSAAPACTNASHTAFEFLCDFPPVGRLEVGYCLFEKLV